MLPFCSAIFASHLPSSDHTQKPLLTLRFSWFRFPQVRRQSNVRADLANRPVHHRESDGEHHPMHLSTIGHVCGAAGQEKLQRKYAHSHPC